MRIIGPVLGLLGILAIVGLVAGLAYSAGLSAAGVVVAPGTTTVVPAVGYGWYGGPFLGFGQFLGFLFVFILFIALIRLAFGGGRHRNGHGWGPDWGWGPGYGRGPGGWNHDHGSTDPSGSGDPREAWIRARLEEWHRTAHADAGGTTTPSTPGSTGSTGSPGPTEPPAAG